MFDILIIGAGPAGSNLARLLGNKHIKGASEAPDYSVCLIDKRRLDLPEDPHRQKACGGLLSPDAQKIMAKLELSLPSSVLEDPQIFKVRTIDFDSGLERYYPRNYLNMNRERFDRYLFGLIPPTVDKRCGMVVTAIYAMDGYWEVHYKDLENKRQIVMAKFLVGADGANSLVRRRCIPSKTDGTEKSSKKYFSIQKWYPIDATLPYFTGIFDSSITDYYSWTIQKGNHLILGTALPCDDAFGPSADATFRRLQHKVSDHLGFTLGEPVKTEGAFIERSMRQSDLCFSASVKVINGSRLPLALIGEAAGATSPTSAEGFSYGLITSFKLFKALNSGLKHAEKRYDLSCNSVRRNLMIKRLKSPAMYWPIVRKVVMATGVTAITTEDTGNATESDFSGRLKKRSVFHLNRQ